MTDAYHSNDDFYRFLVGKAGKRVFLKPYWGNSGDTLIRLGNSELLSRLEITQVVDHRSADIIMWPGGNPTMWNHQQGWEECIEWSKGKEFIIAPATFRRICSGGTWDWPRLLSSAKCDITGVFARDQDSFSELRAAGLPTHLSIGIGHDPAFHLRGSAFVDSVKLAKCEDYVLACFRSDHERLKFGDTPLDRIVSLCCPGFVGRKIHRFRVGQERERKRVLFEGARNQDCEVLWRDASSMDFDSFVECCRRAGEIHTDRLHCMIMGVLLGKKVFAYETAYGKLESVYSHSISDWGDVTFVR